MIQHIYMTSENENLGPQKTCKRMFTAAYIHNNPNWKQPKYPKVEWIFSQMSNTQQ